MAKILIVGGVAGGATAAARLRRLNEQDEIIMFEKDEYISFANCGLPYYIGGVITDRDKLLVQTVEGMSKRFNLDIRNFSEVISINPDKKTVQVLNHQTKEEYIESYDKLILSPGSNPIWPPIPGLKEATNVFKLRNIPDTDQIKAMVDLKPKQAVVIGGGFIGVEMAENLVEKGIKVTLVEKMNQVMAPFDIEMAAMLHNELKRHGVELKLENGVVAFEDHGKTIVLDSGEKIQSDLTILAIGVRPATMLASQAGLELGQTGGIKVDEHLLTSNKDIYACGDAIEVKSIVSGQPTYIPLAWPANRQGRLIADHINGQDVRYPGTLGSSVAKVFNFTAASTGLNAKTCQRLGIEYKSVHIHRANHAGYYPNSSNIALKLIFDPNSHRVLGAQAIGHEGTEKRIDVIATAILAKMTVQDLTELELCYAPPFSSAKDPVNIAGYVASNVVENIYDVVHYDEINQKVSEGALLIDVREPIEYSLGSISGSINIPLDDLRNRLNEIPQDQDVIVSCQVGLRGYLALQILKANGYTRVKNLSGGYKTYSEVFDQTHQEDNNSNDNFTARKELPTLENTTVNIQVDACGLQCPGPIMETYKALEKMNDGEVLKVSASDFGFAKDIEKWCCNTGNTLVNLDTSNKKVEAIVKKGGASNCHVGTTKEKATIVLFSGDLDKAMAAMIIAQGAASMGQEVSIFFTFWGLNALRKHEQDIKVEKNMMEKMFGTMMPQGSERLNLSNMNMMGMGKAMMKKIMKEKNVDDLPTLMKQAQEVGVSFIACTMSMDVMGIKEEEIIPGVEFGGVASYVANSQGAGLTLFI